MKKEEIIDVCKKIAAEYPCWEFSAQAFKNKELKHSVKLIEPLWSFSPGTALAQPVAGFLHKDFAKIYKKLFGFSANWTSRISLEDVHEEYKYKDLRFYDVIADKAEENIREFFERGIQILESTYDFSSEKNLLEKMPIQLEHQSGVSYCLVRAYLGDFDFVRRYRNDEIKTEAPKYYYDVDKIIEHFEIR